MQDRRGRPGSRWEKRRASVAFYAVNVALLPVTGLGYVLWAGSLLVGRRSPASATAQGPLSMRWMMHRLGVRDDVAADRLISVLPGVPPLAPRLFAAPLVWAHHLTGHVPAPLRYPFRGPVFPPCEVAARTTFLDAVVDRHLPAVAQLVVLGAGYDTRAWRLPEDAAVTVFEVDTPATQAAKRQLVCEAGLLADHVAFVPADFEKENWLDRLVTAGFDPRRPALFLWEGVVMYLTAGAVDDTLRTIADTAPGSVVGFDYLSDVPITSRRPLWLAARAVTRTLGEPFTFGIDSSPPLRERLGEFLQSCGLGLDEHRTLGRETKGRRAWGGMATAAVLPQPSGQKSGRV